MQRKHSLCQIDPHSSNLLHDFRSRYQIEHTTLQSWHSNADPGRGSPFHSLALKRMRILLYQLIPIVALLSPFIEVLGLTLYWRRSLSSPWLYGLAGTVVAYAVAGAVMFAVESAKPSGGGTVITSGVAVWRDDG